MPKPIATEHAPYYTKYIDLVNEDDVHDGMNRQTALIESFFRSIPAAKADYAYAEGKWTVKQLLQHLIDTERVFAYRALWIARRSGTPLPGFDENKFADVADLSNRLMNELVDELLAVRKSSQLMFSSFTAVDIQQTGMANNNPLGVNAIGFVMLGHILHHKNILEERYL
jgi:hypothetical protein